MNSSRLRHLTVLLFLIAAVAIVVVLLRVREFAQNTRKLMAEQRLDLQAVKLKPVAEISTSVAAKTAKSPQIAPIEVHPQEIPEAEILTDAQMRRKLRMEAIEIFKEKPHIDICKYLKPDRAQIYRTFKEIPRTFKFLILNRSIEMLFFTERMPKSFDLKFPTEERSSFANDLRYAYAIHEAKVELENNIEKARQVDVRGYYARALAQITLRNPSVLGDPELLPLCESFTDFSIPASQTELNEKTLAFMKRAQVKPDEINFDPHYKSQVEVLKNGAGVWEYQFPIKK